MYSIYSLAMVRNPNEVINENAILSQFLSASNALVVAKNRIDPKLKITDPKALNIILL